VLEATVAAVAVNVAAVAPAFTGTEPGTVTEALLLVRVTAAPAAGAGALRVTVHVLVPGVATEAGEQLRLAGTGGLTVTLAVRLTPPAEAVTVAAVGADTEAAVALNVAVVAPAPMVTAAGTATAG
jgi:hypothetical protein